MGLLTQCGPRPFAYLTAIMDAIIERSRKLTDEHFFIFFNMFIFFTPNLFPLHEEYSRLVSNAPIAHGI